MSTNQLARNKQVAESLLLAIEQRDIAAVDNLLAEDGRFWVIGGMPLSGEKSKAEFMPLVQAMMDIMEGPLRFNIQFVTAEEDRVSVTATGEMRTKAGVQYNNSYHLLLGVRDDLVIWTREYFDTELAIDVFGIAPARPLADDQG